MFQLSYTRPDGTVYSCGPTESKLVSALAVLAVLPTERIASAPVESQAFSRRLMFEPADTDVLHERSGFVFRIGEVLPDH